MCLQGPESRLCPRSVGSSVASRFYSRSYVFYEWVKWRSMERDSQLELNGGRVLSWNSVKGGSQLELKWRSMEGHTQVEVNGGGVSGGGQWRGIPRRRSMGILKWRSMEGVF